MNPFSPFSFLVDAVYDDTLSLVSGTMIGLVGGLIPKFEKRYSGLAAAGILLVFAPIIGVDTMPKMTCERGLKKGAGYFWSMDVHYWTY